jgi:hypothetical protein
LGGVPEAMTLLGLRVVATNVVMATMLDRGGTR